MYPQSKNNPAPEDDFEHTRAALLDHLIELRKRLMIAIFSYLGAVCVAYLFANEAYDFLVAPLAAAFDDPSHKRLIYTGLAEAFTTYIRLALYTGFFLAFPVIAYQLYMFIAPGLYKTEKRVLLPYLVASPVLFFAGAALAYYYVFPLAWKFFISFESLGGAGALPIELEARVSDYLSIVMQLLLAFGLAFQLPVLLTLLTRMGFVSAVQLAKFRRFAIVILLLVAGILTPPDVFSQVGLFVPLYALYELSILCCKYIEKHKETEDLQES